MDKVKEKLGAILTRYFGIGDSYAYNLTRDKAAFGIGTMTMDDFEEFDTDTVADIVEYLVANGVTVQRWIPVTERLPEKWKDVLLIAHGWESRTIYLGRLERCEAEKSWLTGLTSKASEWTIQGWSYLREPNVTHWMPLPETAKEDSNG